MSNTTIDQQFIEYVVKSLVSNPDDVIVERIIDEKGVLLTLTVNPEDLGRVIGKRGATAQSLRTLLRALGTKQEARYNLKIVDNGYPRPEREEQSESNDSRPVREEQQAPVKESQEVSSSPVPEQQSTRSEDSWGSEDDSASAAQDAANDSGEEESAIERTRRELEDLDDLDV
jgi:predicted RNA-binding protein YlqC (UPF0109 family)